MNQNRTVSLWLGLGAAFLLAGSAVSVGDAGQRQGSAAVSAAAPVWSIQLRYQGIAPENVKVAATSDGGAFFAYEADEFDPPDCNSFWPIICRLDARGRILWQKELRGILSDWPLGVSLLATPDGGCLYGDISIPAHLIKLSSGGQVAWSKTYSTPLNSLSSLKLAPGPGGDFYLAGYAYSQTLKRSVLNLSRMSASGEPRWSRSIEPAPYAAILSLAGATSGGVFLAGGCTDGGFWAAALDSQGGLSWAKAYTVRPQMVMDGFFGREDGGMLVALGLYSSGWWYRDAGAMRLDAGGNVLWCRSFDGEEIVYRRGWDDGGDEIVTRYNGLQRLLPDGRLAAAYPVSFSDHVDAGGSAAEGGLFLAGEDCLVKTDTLGRVDGCSPSSDTGSVSNPEAYAPKAISVALSDDVLTSSPFNTAATTAPLTLSLICRDPNFVYLNIKAAEGGRTAPPAGLTGYERGASVAVEASPYDFYDFSEWSGDVPEGLQTLPAFVLAMIGDRTLQPRFLKIQAPLNATGNRILAPSRAAAFDVLTWTTHPENQSVEKYRVFSVVDGVETLLAEVPAAACRYINRKAPRGGPLLYAVCAVTASGREGVRAPVEIR
jgi:hypothetical protein